MKKLILMSIFLLIASCATQDKVQDVYTDDSNYFDYQYYFDTDFSQLDEFEQRPGGYFDYEYDYYDSNYESGVYEGAGPPPPVQLEEAPPRNSDDWFFEDY